MLAIRKSGSSCGAIIEVRASGVPVGLGAPIYAKLDMDLASAMTVSYTHLTLPTIRSV